MAGLGSIAGSLRVRGRDIVAVLLLLLTLLLARVAVGQVPTRLLHSNALGHWHLRVHLVHLRLGHSLQQGPQSALLDPE